MISLPKFHLPESAGVDKQISNQELYLNEGAIFQKARRKIMLL